MNQANLITHSCSAGGLPSKESCAVPQHRHRMTRWLRKMQRVKSARGLGRLTQPVLALQAERNSSNSPEASRPRRVCKRQRDTPNATLHPRNMPVRLTCAATLDTGAWCCRGQRALAHLGLCMLSRAGCSQPNAWYTRSSWLSAGLAAINALGPGCYKCLAWTPPLSNPAACCLYAQNMSCIAAASLHAHLCTP